MPVLCPVACGQSWPWSFPTRHVVLGSTRPAALGTSSVIRGTCELSFTAGSQFLLLFKKIFILIVKFTRAQLTLLPLLGGRFRAPAIPAALRRHHHPPEYLLRPGSQGSAVLPWDVAAGGSVQTLAESPLEGVLAALPETAEGVEGRELHQAEFWFNLRDFLRIRVCTERAGCPRRSRLTDA